MYTDDPCGGKAVPGGTAQVVSGRASSVRVHHERLTYGFAQDGRKHMGPVVPTGAQNLLRTTFPSLTDAQRRSVLSQAVLPSGYPLDATGAEAGWQRLDLAEATSATVDVRANGAAIVVRTGGTARVVRTGR